MFYTIIKYYNKGNIVLSNIQYQKEGILVFQYQIFRKKL